MACGRQDSFLRRVAQGISTPTAGLCDTCRMRLQAHHIMLQMGPYTLR
jgi:ribosomal protein L32